MAEEKKDKKKKRAHAGHGFRHTHIEHHDDGSHTVEHQHEDPTQSKKYAAADHDALMDGMMDHTSEPNPGEAEADRAEAVAPPSALATQGNTPTGNPNTTPIVNA